MLRFVQPLGDRFQRELDPHGTRWAPSQADLSRHLVQVGGTRP
jgi:hypothetical protein